jgi:hypothetical protein
MTWGHAKYARCAGTTNDHDTAGLVAAHSLIARASVERFELSTVSGLAAAAAPAAAHPTATWLLPTHTCHALLLTPAPCHCSTRVPRAPRSALPPPALPPWLIPGT